jgi:hypothetical protein
VHKHASVVPRHAQRDAAGIRYDTSNATDAFSAALTDIADFDVDYLEESRDQTAQRQDVQFHRSAGNADPLFAFHRDVDHARQKPGGGSQDSREYDTRMPTPYAEHLNGGDPVEACAHRSRTTKRVATLTPARWNASYAPGKWSRIR